MSKKVMTDWGEVNEPNQDDSLSRMDLFRLRKAMLKITEKFPKYKKWIYAVEFKRETFHLTKYVYMYVYLNDVEIDHMDVLDIENNIIEESEEIDTMLYYCEVLGSMGYTNKDILGVNKGVFIIDSLIREEKIDSIL